MRIIYWLKHLWKIPFEVHNMGYERFVTDYLFIKSRYREEVGLVLNLKNPSTFNEKLQWLKLYDRNPLYTLMVDKKEAKNYVASIIGSEYIVPTLGVWDCFDEIDFNQLPNQFVLKCTHDSGGTVICKDKRYFDCKKAKEKLEKALSTDYCLLGREWPYKNVPRKILAEEYLEDTEYGYLKDYKFFCFNGIVKCFKIDYGRETEHHANYYSPDGKLLDIGEKVCPPIFEKQLGFPKELEKMKLLAQELSSHLPLLRVDFYVVKGRVYFGELTLYPSAGLGRFLLDTTDRMLGDWLELPRIN